MPFTRRSLLGVAATTTCGGTAIGLTPALLSSQGDGKADDSTALARALNAAKSGERAVLLEAGKTYRSGDLRIPRGVTLIFASGARLSPAHQGAMLTVDGTIESVGLNRIFDDGWVFKKSEPDILDGFKDVPIEWFGGRASWTERPDSLPAFYYAIAFCKAVRCRAILLANGCYFISDTIRIDGPVGIKGAGMQSTFLFRNGGETNSAIIELAGIKDRAVANLDFSGFSLMTFEKDGVGTGISADWFAHIRLADLQFRSLEIGLQLSDGAYTWRIVGCLFLSNRTHVVLGSNANNLLISQSQFIHGETGIDCVGSSNSLSISDETNFESLSGSPLRWRGQGTTLYRLSISNCRFEKCRGSIGFAGGSARALAFSFDRSFAENVNGTSAHCFDLTNCESVVISRSYFQRYNVGLVNAPKSAVQVIISDNFLVAVPQINSASPTGGFGPNEGYVRCRAYNCGQVKGAEGA